MSDRPPRADEATRLLRDAEERRGQGAREAAQESRWVSVLFGLALFAQLAAPDFFGEKVRPWLSWTVVALLAVYMVMLRTRRGSGLLGRPARLRKSEISPRFAKYARWTVLLVLVAGFAVALYGNGPLFPYAGTVLGVVLGGGLIAFGPAWQKGLNSLATRGDSPAALGRRHDGGTARGAR